MGMVNIIVPKDSIEIEGHKDTGLSIDNGKDLSAFNLGANVQFTISEETGQRTTYELPDHKLYRREDGTLGLFEKT